MNKHEQLIMDVYTTREASKLAKRARNAKRDESGGCQNDEMDEEGYVAPCCYSREDLTWSEWCEPCKETHRLSEVYWGKSNKAGAALRAVIFEGKRLAKDAAE